MAPPRSYADIDPRPPSWLWAGRIPRREVTVVVGPEGIGKSFFGADLSSRVTADNYMPDGSDGLGKPASVLLVTPEDDPNSAMAYRLRAAGADLANVYDMTEGFRISDEGIAALRAHIDAIAPTQRQRARDNEPAQASDVKLIWIDPLSANTSVSLTSSNTRVRQKVIDPLRDVARDYDLSIVAIVHTTKNGSVAGSKAVTEAARSVLMVERVILRESDIRVLKIHKSNVGDDKLAPIAYTIAGAWPDLRVEYFEVPDEALAFTPGPVPLRAKIAAILRESETPMKSKEIWLKLADDDPELQWGTVRTALTRLGEDPQSEVIHADARGYWTVRPFDGPIIGLGPMPQQADDLLREVDDYLRGEPGSGNDQGNPNG